MANGNRKLAVHNRAAIGAGVAATATQALAALLAWQLTNAAWPDEVITQVQAAVISLGTALLVGLGTWARTRGPFVSNTLGVLGLALLLALAAPGCATVRAALTGQVATEAESVGAKWVLAVKAFESAQDGAIIYLSSTYATPAAAEAIRRASYTGALLVRASGAAVHDPNLGTVTIHAVDRLEGLTAEILRETSIDEYEEGQP
jgi:hypothetical protein